MINNIEALRKAYLGGEKFDFHLFWGHTPSKDGTIQSTCLSQWWPCTFTEDNHTYSCTEQYMMAGKAKLFDDQAILAQILQAYEPKTMKALGRKVGNFDEQVWKQHRYDIVVQGNWLKFSQNKELKDFLLSTGNSVLVEASPFDRIWGIGMGKENENAQNPTKWRGSNLLGFALMAVRAKLMADDPL